jgi:hypothetical protein
MFDAHAGEMHRAREMNRVGTAASAVPPSAARRICNLSQTLIFLE